MQGICYRSSTPSNVSYEAFDLSGHSNIQLRTLDKIYAELQVMHDQGRVERIANSAHDEAALSGYVGDINDALTDYQVRLDHIRSLV